MTPTNSPTCSRITPEVPAGSISVVLVPGGANLLRHYSPRGDHRTFLIRTSREWKDAQPSYFKWFVAEAVCDLVEPVMLGKSFRASRQKPKAAPAPRSLSMPRRPSCPSRASGRCLRMEPLEDRRLLAGDLELVRDINQTPTGGRPSNLVEAGGVMYFTADDRVHGVEVWRTDGTESGTYLLKDIRPGATSSHPTHLTSVGGTLYFSASDGVNGRVLWKSDGTEAGTQVVRDTDSEVSGSDPFDFVEVNGTLFFVAKRNSTVGWQVWKTNGPDAGTVQVTNIPKSSSAFAPNVSQLTNVNGTLYFVASDGLNGLEIWKSDGTIGNAVRVSDVRPGPGGAAPEDLTAVGDTLYFTADDGITGRELWKTDGTAAGAVQVADIRSGSTGSVGAKFGPDLLNVGGVLYFVADDYVHGRELWRADATGATMVKDINPRMSGTGGGTGSSPNWLTDVGGTLYFAASGLTGGQELWKSDGTEAGTVLVKEIWPGPLESSPSELIDVAGRLYFAASDSDAGNELWTSDGTEQGTFRVADIRPGASGSGPRFLASVGNVVYFSANDGVTGPELWKTDGPSNAAQLVKDIVPGALDGVSPAGLTDVGGVLYFTARESAGVRLWRSDGTQAGTVPVQSPQSDPIATSPNYLADIDGALYFRANGTEVWRSDGTPDGTVSITAGLPGSLSSSSSSNLSHPDIVQVGGRIFFVALNYYSGEELWTSDGTEAGTRLVFDTLPNTSDIYSSGASPSNLTDLNGTLYYFTRLNELWKSDGTEAGTTRLDTLPSPSAPAKNLTSVGGTLYFTASESGFGEELWKSDGTPGSAVRVKDIWPGNSGSSPSNLIDVGGTLFFTAENRYFDLELWKSDGTSEGTVRVKDIADGFRSSEPRELTNVGGVLYFTAGDSSGDRELWKSDGTEAGTVRVKDIRPGVDSSSPSNLTNINGVLYFRAYDGIHGSELWKSDGTEAGTVPVRLAGDLPLTYPTSIAASGGRLYVSGSRPEVGSELFSLDLTPALPGDYDQSGEVDLLDYDLWKANFGATNGPGLAADGNIDGVVDAADYAVWRDHLGMSVPEPAAALALGGGTAELQVDTLRGTFYFSADPPPFKAAPPTMARHIAPLPESSDSPLLRLADATSGPDALVSPRSAALPDSLDEAFASLALESDLRLQTESRPTFASEFPRTTSRRVLHPNP